MRCRAPRRLRGRGVRHLQRSRHGRAANTRPRARRGHGRVFDEPQLVATPVVRNGVAAGVADVAQVGQAILGLVGTVAFVIGSGGDPPAGREHRPWRDGSDRGCRRRRTRTRGPWVARGRSCGGRGRAAARCARRRSRSDGDVAGFRPGRRTPRQFAGLPPRRSGGHARSGARGPGPHRCPTARRHLRDRPADVTGRARRPPDSRAGGRPLMGPWPRCARPAQRCAEPTPRRR